MHTNKTMPKQVALATKLQSLVAEKVLRKHGSKGKKPQSIAEMPSLLLDSENPNREIKGYFKELVRRVIASKNPSLETDTKLTRLVAKTLTQAIDAEKTGITKIKNEIKDGNFSNEKINLVASGMAEIAQSIVAKIEESIEEERQNRFFSSEEVMVEIVANIFSGAIKKYNQTKKPEHQALGTAFLKTFKEKSLPGLRVAGVEALEAQISSLSKSNKELSCDKKSLQNISQKICHSWQTETLLLALLMPSC